MRVSYENLFGAVCAILTKCGAEKEEARLVADSLATANLRGIHSHGVKYLKMIRERIDAGMLNVPTRAAILDQSKAVSLIDGNNGFGQVAACMAMNLSIERAGEYGVAVTFVRNTNNIGFLSYYTMMAAGKDCVGLCACNAAASISLWGGMEPVLGSNPISIAFPTDSGSPLVMDLSVSNVARGKIREADRLRKDIPPTWAFGPDGEPTTDPAEALKGVLMPIGGPKGVALAIAVDILAGVISGSKYSRDVKTFHKLQGETGVGAFFLAINPKDIIDPAMLKKLLGQYVVNIKDIEKGRNVSEIFLPGEIENQNQARGRTEGIELDASAIEMLNGMLSDFGCDMKIQ